MEMVAVQPMPVAKPRGRRRWWLRLLVLVVTVAVLRLGSEKMFSATHPGELEQGRLMACPNSPNCVCSQDTAPQHAIAPLSFTSDVATARARLLKALATLPRIKILVDQPEYLHATSTTLIMRFVDDLEFLIDPQAKVIHVRSASRLGYSDLGVNRKRVEALRQAWVALE